MSIINECSAPVPRTMLQRAFPSRYMEPCDWENPEPGFAPGEFTTNVVVHVSWLDRLRLLVSGRAQVDIRTATDKTVDKAKSRSTFYVLPPGR